MRLLVEQTKTLGLLAYANILRHRQRRQKRQFLKNTDDTRAIGFDRMGELHRPPLQHDLTFVGLHYAGDRLDQGALTCAVLTENGVDRTGVAAKVNAVECRDATIALRHSPQL